jgi:hypothetical protein
MTRWKDEISGVEVGLYEREATQHSIVQSIYVSPIDTVSF